MATSEDQAATEATAADDAGATSDELVPLIVFSDYICPFCYLGQVIIDGVRREFEVDVEFRSFLLAPNCPPEGQPLPGLPEDRATQFVGFKAIADQLGLPVVQREWTSYSRRALEATEYARDEGMIDPFRRVVFRQYWADNLDISQDDVLRAAAVEVGLDADAMLEAVNDRRFSERIDEDMDIAGEIGVKGVPSYLMAGNTIHGQAPFEHFARLLIDLGQLPKHPGMREQALLYLKERAEREAVKEAGAAAAGEAASGESSAVGMTARPE
jgi:predicted DsbA family dithiol-disulfide isomerase